LRPAAARGRLTHYEPSGRCDHDITPLRLRLSPGPVERAQPNPQAIAPGSSTAQGVDAIPAASVSGLPPPARL